MDSRRESVDYRTVDTWEIVEKGVDVQPVDEETCVVRIGDSHERITLEDSLNLIIALAANFRMSWLRLLGRKEK